MNKTEKVIMHDSPEAATKVNMDLWKSIDGRVWMREDTARYHSHTHKVCECGGIAEKGYMKCPDCRQKLRRERYLALPFVEWDVKAAVCTTDGDKYFFSEESIIDFMQQDEGYQMDEIDLIICDENEWQTIGEDYWADYMPEDGDGDLPAEMQKALNNLNAIIKRLPPQSYSPGKKRTNYKLFKQ